MQREGFGRRFSQHCKYTTDFALKMVKMVNFMLRVFHHNKKSGERMKIHYTAFVCIDCIYYYLYLALKLRHLGAPGWLGWFGVRLLISAQVMISWFMSLSPALSSVLSAWAVSLLSPSSLPLPHCALSIFPSLSKTSKETLKKF